MVDLSKTFVHCLHCDNYTPDPRNVCPRCDWPRAHSDETPPPTISMADPNEKFVPAQPVQVREAQPYAADVKVEVQRPVVIPGQAPARLDQIAEVGMIPTATTTPLERLRSITLAPDDPVEEGEAE